MIKKWSKKGSIILFSALLLASLTGCNKKKHHDDIPVVGLDKEGKSILRHIPRGRLFRKLGGTMGDITNKSTNKLEKYHFTKGFELTRVTVGLGAVAEFGIDDIAKIEFVSSFELRLEKLPLPSGVTSPRS